MTTAGIDFSQYATWPTMTAPTGAVYYKVPGTGYVYDPFLSAAKGRPVLWTNPQPAVDEKKKAEKAAKDAASPLNQIMPVVGQTAGIVGAKYMIDALGPKTAAEEFAKQQLAQKATEQAVAQQATQLPSADYTLPPWSPNPGAEALPGTAEQAFTEAASPTTGAPIVDGAAMPYQSGLTVGNALSAVAVAKGSYDAFQGMQNGGEGTRSGLTTAGAGIGSLVGGPLGAGVGAAAGNVIGYGLQGDGWKNDAALMAMGPAGWGFLAAKKLGLTNHKTTKQHQQEKWGGLAKDGIAGAQQQYQALQSLGDMSGKMFADDGSVKEWNFDEALNQVKRDPTQFLGVYGNYKTFGNDWDKYSVDQKKAIVSGIANAGLYNSSKGDVHISDEEAARKIKDQVLGLSPNPVATQAGTAGPAPVMQQLPPGQFKTLQGTPPAELGKQLAQRINARTWR